MLGLGTWVQAPRTPFWGPGCLGFGVPGPLGPWSCPLPNIWGAEPRRELAKPRGRARPAAGRCLQLSLAVPCCAARLDRGMPRAGCPKLLGAAACPPCQAMHPLWMHGALPTVPCHPLWTPSPGASGLSGTARRDFPRQGFSLLTPMPSGSPAGLQPLLPAMQSPSSHPARHTPLSPLTRCLCWGPAPVNPGCGDFAPL